MRTALIAIGAVAVTAAILVGVLQARDSDRATQAAPAPLSLAEVSKPLAGAPQELAVLRTRVNALETGGEKTFDAQLRALRGYPVVVNLWASWCEPCRYELPFLQRQAVKRGARVAFLGVNVGDNRVAAREFAGRYPMPYPSVEDPRSNVAARYGARGLPATAFYDARGELAVVHQGVFPNERTLSEEIERYALR